MKTRKKLKNSAKTHKVNHSQSQNVVVMSNIRIDTYRVIQEAIDKGVRYGYKRAHKYVDDPSEEKICEEINTCVMNELCDLLKFEET